MSTIREVYPTASLLHDLDQWSSAAVGLTAVIALLLAASDYRKGSRLEAAKVFATWVALDDGNPLEATVVNRSDGPVAEIDVSYMCPVRTVGLLMPSQESAKVLLGTWHSEECPGLKGPAIELRYTDGIGKRWMRSGQSPPRRIRPWNRIRSRSIR